MLKQLVFIFLLYNKCVEYGVFLEHFKFADTIPIMNLVKNDSNNYGSISLLSLFSKIFDYLV